MHHFRGKIPKKVFTPQKKTSGHISKIGIFSKQDPDILFDQILLNIVDIMEFFFKIELISKIK